MSIQVFLKCRYERQRVLIDRKSDLTMRSGSRRYSVDRALRVTGAHGQDFKRIPAEYPFCLSQSAFPPPSIDFGPIVPRIDHDV